MINCTRSGCRFTSCVEFDTESHGAFITHRSSRHIRYYYLRHRWSWNVLRKLTQDMLHQRLTWVTLRLLLYSFVHAHIYLFTNLLKILQRIIMKRYHYYYLVSIFTVSFKNPKFCEKKKHENLTFVRVSSWSHVTFFFIFFIFQISGDLPPSVKISRRFDVRCIV